jgi:DHA1 family bicyclomycin/chloramphenicol resistance-like MFS transporter
MLVTDMRTDAARRDPPLWGLAVLTLSGTLAMHIFVPALPVAGVELGASAAQMQMTITFYIIGLAIGQLIYGPVSDRFGRRVPLLVGLAIYTLASVVAMLAPDIGTLVSARLFAALGGCAGMVLGRVIVRDTTRDMSDAAGRLALMNMMVVVGPGLAPTVGGFLSNQIGWRSIFMFLSLLGLVNIVYTLFLLRETRPETAATRGARNNSYWVLLRSRGYMGFALGGGFSTTSIYAVVTATPFVFVHQLGRSSQEAGLYLTLVMAGMVIGNMLARNLLHRFNLSKVLLGANVLSLLSAACMLVAALFFPLTVVSFIGPAFVFSIAAGLTSPGAATEAISVNPEMAGAASGLYGCGQMVIGAVCTFLAGLGSNHAVSASVVLVIASLIGQIALRSALKVSATNAPRVSNVDRQAL